MGTRRLRISSVTDPPAKTRTEVKERIRSQSFTDAVVAKEWLNDAKVQKSAAYRRVLAVRQELEELREGIDRFTQQTSKSHVLKVCDQAELATRANNLDRLLSGYRFKPEMNCGFATGIWALEMVPVHPRGPRIEVRGQGFAYLPRRVQVSEPIVITALMRLAANRELAKVHLCTTCKKRWHVAVRRIDQFCSAPCREQYHTDSDEYRERKKNKQREYRDLRKHVPTLK